MSSENEKMNIEPASDALEAATEAYNRWLSAVTPDEQVALKLIAPADIADAFGRDLSFGTGGMRGKLGLGPNRLNIYTVAKATQGLANYLTASFDNPTVVLCYDTRHGSKAFVRRVAEVLAGNGIMSYLFERVEPTPAQSFAVRELGCSAGVVITASHNPADYNGYKVYGSDGCQITVAAARAIQAAIDPIDVFDGVTSLSFDEGRSQGLIQWVPERVLDRYIEETVKCSTSEECRNLKVVYTPLHGVGLECVSRALKAIGVPDPVLVEEQCVQDGDFPTCPYPNPEVREALELGIRYCEETDADLLLATDPDTDRLGIAVRHEGKYELLTGNELGLLLLDFLAKKVEESGEDISRKVAGTTIVSAPMADDMAHDHGFELRRTLTGFKFIGEQIGLLEQEGREGGFLMGFEESYGYLAGTSVRDKDAVVSAMLTCELAAHWKAEGLDLYEAMDSLYAHYGYWGNAQLTKAFEGAEGPSRMAAIVDGLRAAAPSKVAGIDVMEIIDYIDDVDMPTVNPSGAVQKLPPSNVIELRLVDGSRVLLRPSGTEPKVKAYLFAKAATRSASDEKLAQLKVAVKEILEGCS
ncbi:phospho-sugar mutase [Paratractidigestivibacter sp.]|uniref:phospho-sugar mutase n=1 Tax=Paratractidigestivibacter sp. TaxID=2847316 RepID=UPI002ACB0C19|nr:phospho-sugar mutase [Paratractidigestivibacter sp.]